MSRTFSGMTRNAHLWLPGLVRASLRRSKQRSPRRVWVAFADHFEPFWKGADEAAARARVKLWRRRWPEIAAGHRDSAGRPPRYTFFYAQEEYSPDLLDMLAEMVEAGVADVDVHLHHDGEGVKDFVARINRFTRTLYHRHGLLRKHDGKVAFGFIHGNWALDNSRPDGRWCGLNNEISLLRELGCYADFTMPSAPSPTQARLVNTIYWATDDPERPKSYDTGIPVTVGGGAPGDLLMIPGPLALDWLGRRRLLLPRLEIGELAAYARPTRHRVRLWLRHAPRLGDNIFIKLFTHGAQERNAETLLGGDLESLLRTLREECSARQLEVYFVSAREMWQAVEAVRLEQDFFNGLDSSSRKTMALDGAGRDRGGL